MTLRQTIRRAAKLAVSDGVPMRALGVAILIGTILNLINQGDALILGAPISWTKLILTYLVPYAVSTHGAVAVGLRKSE